MALINYGGYTFDEGTYNPPPIWEYVDDAIKFGYTPSPTVLKWLQSRAIEHGMIGGRGSGKTTGGGYKALEIVKTFPGMNGIIIRKNKNDNLESMLDTFMQDVCPPEYLYKFDKEESCAYIDCNLDQSVFSKIWFLGSDKRKGSGQMKWRGRKFGFFIIDEAQEFGRTEGEAIYKELFHAMRQRGYPRFFAMTIGNGAGHNWQEGIYLQKTMVNGEAVYTPRQGKELYRVSSLENSHNLPPGYIKDIIDSYPPDLVKRYIEGSSDAADGVIFKEFGEIHLINSWEYPIRANWDKYVGIDPGFAAAPFAAEWMAVDGFGNKISYDEYYEKNDRLSYHAEKILDKIAGDEIVLIDSAAQQKHYDSTGRMVSTRDDLSEYGLSTILANKNVSDGIRRMIEAVHPTPRRKHPVTGMSPAPAWYIFKDKCPFLVEAIRNYLWGDMEKKGEEKPKENQEDHPVDCVRYIFNQIEIGKEPEEDGPPVPPPTVESRLEKMNEDGFEFTVRSKQKNWSDMF